MSLFLAALLQAASAAPADAGTLLSQITDASHWELVSADRLPSAGSGGQQPLYGPGGIDVLIFTTDGDMCAIASKPSPPAEDVKAYCGEFKLNESQRSIVFDIQTDALPNDLGSGVKRTVSVNGDILTLTVKRPNSDAEGYSLTLKRSPKP
jgi:hypothetical protein